MRIWNLNEIPQILSGCNYIPTLLFENGSKYTTYYLLELQQGVTLCVFWKAANWDLHVLLKVVSGEIGVKCECASTHGGQPRHRNDSHYKVCFICSGPEMHQNSFSEMHPNSFQESISDFTKACQLNFWQWNMCHFNAQWNLSTVSSPPQPKKLNKPKKLPPRLNVSLCPRVQIQYFDKYFGPYNVLRTILKICYGFFRKGESTAKVATGYAILGMFFPTPQI